MRKQIARAALVVVALSLRAAAAEPVGPKFPTAYREWTHVKSMLIYSDKHPLYAPFNGLHHVYVNKIGLAAVKAHGKFADGAILVFDLLQADDVDGAYVEGSRKLVAVMQKDSKKYKDTGGWGFQGFKAGNANDPVVSDPVGQCFNCHQSQKDADFVFSKFRD